MPKKKIETASVRLYRETDVERESPLRDQTTFDAQGGHRSEFRRDYARLVHSPAFRRLQGKTQLFPGTESDFFRNRLTHSMEVAQIAKGIALKVNSTGYFLENPLNTDLVEVAALGHDLGHPPFGHNGEYALDECMRDFGGFEGNAQTLRIVARLEKRETAKPNGDTCGLNFTYRSFAALLKYDKPIPTKNEDREKPGRLSKGYYASEAELVSRIKAAVSPECLDRATFRTVECEIMDIADDIAYSTYDLEDAFKAGFFNPLEILSHLVDTNFLERIAAKVRAANVDVADVTASEVAMVLTETFGRVIADGVEDVKKSDSFNAIYDIVKIYAASKRIASDGFLRTSFTSDLVKEFIEGVSIDLDEKCPATSKIVMKRQTRLKIEALKHLTFEALTLSPRLRLVEYRGRDLVRSIFTALSEDSGYMLLPDDWRQRYIALEDDEGRRKRLICDFVAGMTDRYAVEFYARLTSVDSELSFFKPF